VQLGRSDGSKPADGAAAAPLWDLEQPTAEGIRAAAARSGLSDKEAVALAGALGALEGAAAAMAARVSGRKPCSDGDGDEVRGPGAGRLVGAGWREDKGEGESEGEAEQGREGARKKRRRGRKGGMYGCREG
jgi:hypothetical protein